MTNALLPTESERRAAALAVARFGADRVRVEQALQDVLRARARGELADFLDALVAAGVLTESEAGVVRLEVDMTRVGDAPTGDLPTDLVESGTSVPPPEPGEELRQVGPFRLVRRLGQGGMGSVHLGYDDRRKAEFAVKVLADRLAGSPAYIERFYREARTGLLLDHPNVVRSIASGQDADTGKHYLVLEYVDGPSAQDLLERHGRLAVGDAVHIALDIARALEHAHARSIVHRDVKPDNILITMSGVAKLSDLGLAKRLDEDSHLTALRQGFGTVYYMPYEQVYNARVADARSDIYALGATLYHLVTGVVPFPGASAAEVAEKKLVGTFAPASRVNSAVPEVLDRILERMLAREPRDRYQMASELIVDLERTELAAAVPSFADPDRAKADPVVQARRSAAAEPTRLDLRAPGVGPPAPDTWLLRYRDRHGKWRRTRMPAGRIVERLQAGRMPAGVLACPPAGGAFRPLRTYPEFQGVARQRRRPRGAPVAAPPAEPVPAEPAPVVAVMPAPDLPAPPAPATPRLRRSTLVGLGIIAAVLAAVALATYKLALP